VDPQTGVPRGHILSAVLTPHHFHDHAVHQDFFRTHMVTKGQELAAACLSIIENLAAVAYADEARDSPRPFTTLGSGAGGGIYRFGSST